MWLRDLLNKFLQEMREMLRREDHTALLKQSLDLNKQILWILKFPSPSHLRVVFTGETETMQIQYNIQLPALPANAADIDHGELSIVTNGGAPDVRTVAKDATSVDGLTGPLNATVDLSFVYVDAAGNKSSIPSTTTVTLVDTFPPPNPGALGITEVAEVEDAPATDNAPPADAPATDAPSTDPSPSADPATPADPGTPPSSDTAPPADAPPADAGSSTDSATPPSDAPTT